MAFRVEGKQLAICEDPSFWETAWVTEELDGTQPAGSQGPQGTGRAQGGAPRPFLSVQLAWDSHLHTPVPQANNDILAFLSGMPVTRNTKYLDLKNSVSQDHPPPHPVRPSSLSPWLE